MPDSEFRTGFWVPMNTEHPKVPRTEPQPNPTSALDAHEQEVMARD